MKLIREVGNIVQDNWDKGVDTKNYAGKVKLLDFLLPSHS